MLAAGDTWSHRSVRPTDTYIAIPAGIYLHSNCLLISTYHTMSSDDVLPTYEEAMKIHQTPWHIIEEEAMHLTFNEPSATSKIKSIISRRESASQHGVYTGPKRKSKIVVFVENMLFSNTDLATRHTLSGTLTCLSSSSSQEVPRRPTSRPGRLE